MPQPAFDAADEINYPSQNWGFPALAWQDRVEPVPAPAPTRARACRYGVRQTAYQSAAAGNGTRSRRRRSPSSWWLSLSARRLARLQAPWPSSSLTWWL